MLGPLSQSNVLVLALAVSAVHALGQSTPFEQASLEVRERNFTHALTLLESVLEKSPNDLKARNLSGIALVALGRGEEANRQFQRALSIDKAFLPALKNLAANELLMGLDEAARKHFEQAVQIAPNDSAINFGLAQIAFGAHRFDVAYRHFRMSGDLYLRDPQALLNYAVAALEAKQPADALAALRLLPAEGIAGIHFEAGLELAKMRLYEDAARHFEMARAGAADSYQVDFNLTLALLKDGNFAAALRASQQTIANGGRTTEAYSLLSKAYEGLSKTTEAYEALRTATVSYPKDESAYLELIALCVEHENYNLALEIAGIGLRQIPSSRRLHVQRGIALAMMNRFEEAARDLAAPEDTLGWIARSLVLMRSGRVTQAVTDLRGLKTRIAADSMVDWLFAEALTESGEGTDEEAIAALQESVQLNPAMPQSRLLLGKLLLAKGDAAHAVEQLESALALDPASVAVTYQLAKALRKNGDTERAAKLFAQVGKQKVGEDADVTRGGLLRIVRPPPE